MGGINEGAQPAATIVADAKFQSRGHLRLEVRPNKDISLPFAYIAVLHFEDVGSPIAQVSAIAVRDAGSDTDLSLTALIVKVAAGYWLAGVAERDREPSDTAALLRAEALTIRVLLASGETSVLVLKKGAAGRKVFRRAMANRSASIGAPAQPNGRAAVAPLEFPPERILPAGRQLRDAVDELRFRFR